MGNYTGLCFEDLQVGFAINSQARTVTETDVVQFAGLSGDYNALHTDVEYARQRPLGQRVAHGLLGLSIASGLAARTGFMEGTIVAFTGLTWHFREPILLGDTIHLRARVTRRRAMASAGGGFVSFDVQVLNQRDEVVQQGEWTLLMRSREIDDQVAQAASISAADSPTSE